MDMSAEVEESGKKVKSRKGADGQETVAKRKPVDDRIEDLMILYRSHETAGKDLSEAINAVAEKSGLNAGVVRKYVAARAGDKFEDKAKEVSQLAFLFDALT